MGFAVEKGKAISTPHIECMCGNLSHAVRCWVSGFGFPSREGERVCVCVCGCVCVGRTMT